MSKFKTQNKIIIALVSLSLVLCLSVGITVAYLVASSDELENEFEASRVSCAVVENGQDPVSDGSVNITGAKEDVFIKNTGDISAFIRATVIISWKKADGTVYAKAPVEGTDYIITPSSNTGWSKSGDIYYYTSSVAAGALTGKLIDSCAPVDGRAPEGYVLSVEIVASAVQAEPESVVEDEWGVEVTNGRLTSFPQN
jgi:hypothetical protein